MQPLPRHTLSKSTFLRGCQCVKSLYLNKYQPELKGQASQQQQALFDRGTDIGELARLLFPGGTDASPENYYDYQASVAYTQELVDAGHTIIYEAAFQCYGVLAAIDILVKENGVWRGYEVKSATSIKDTHVLDATLQHWVITQSGLVLEDVFIVHLNNQYSRTGNLEIRKLFTIESIKDDILEAQASVDLQIPLLKEVLKLSEAPPMDIGEQCFNPYPCDFIGHCWRHIPQPSVFDIARLGEKKKFDLYRKGIVRYEDITETIELNEHQRLQINCHLHQTTHIDRPALQQFLNELPYPLYFLDFETFNPAVPLYDHSRPYQQIPFQYSIHYKKNREGELRHTEFLAMAKGDPRPAFIIELLGKTAMPGTILTYNQSFEKSILKRLASDFPQYAAALEERISRIRDLMPPFQQGLYYTPEMNGAYSIKDVLPALVPELSYDTLPINNGIDASLAFEQMVFEYSDHQSALRKNLLAYCKMDTLAMVRILEKLEKV